MTVHGAKFEKMTGLLILSILGVASAGHLGHHDHGHAQVHTDPTPLYSAPGQPGFGGQQPGFGGQQPGFGGQQPGFGDQRPGFGGQRPGFGGQQPGFGTSPGIDGSGNADSTVVVTETAAHATQTVSREVTVTKTATRDIYTTIYAPTYNSVARIVTNFVKETVTVQEEQVIRSPLAGSVIVSTVPGQATVVITVTNTATQFFVETTLDTITHTLNHFVPNFNFRTVTVNDPQTTTVIETISQTSVTTAFVTNTVHRTLQRTSTVVITVAGSAVSTGYY